MMNPAVKIMDTPDKINLKAKMVENLKQTFDLIELHQELKFALYKKLYPAKNDDELLRMISKANLQRKQAAWKPQTI
ncbi:MAG: hypothetical protein MUF15_05495 [Acidobacteria bacterium]|jgi:hypothetical protein|nr:hypothetical protein [Acidobacteriota bacterium]